MRWIPPSSSSVTAWLLASRSGTAAAADPWQAATESGALGGTGWSGADLWWAGSFGLAPVWFAEEEPVEIKGGLLSELSIILIVVSPKETLSLVRSEPLDGVNKIDGGLLSEVDLCELFPENLGLGIFEPIESVLASAILLGCTGLGGGGPGGVG